MTHIYTDGGCRGNPGPGGWAYLIAVKTFQGYSIAEEGWGCEENTTNNRMEIMAVISALKKFKTKRKLPKQCTVYTDSQYVQKGMTEWIHAWKKNSWRTSSRTAVKNQDLWQELDALAGELTVSWIWVKGHAGNEYNERCDKLTQKAIASLA